MILAECRVGVVVGVDEECVACSEVGGFAALGDALFAEVVVGSGVVFGWSGFGDAAAAGLFALDADGCEFGVVAERGGVGGVDPADCCVEVVELAA